MKKNNLSNIFIRLNRGAIDLLKFEFRLTQHSMMSVFIISEFIYLPRYYHSVMNSSENIIKDIKQGNKESFREFFDDFYPILCSFAKKFLKTSDKSKDAAQDALLKFWEKRHDFDDIKGVKSFLYVVVKNNCINILKKSKNNVALSSLNNLESESFYKKNIIDQETFRIVRNALNKLPKRQKEIIELSMKGLKNPEIALQMEISPHTVHTAKKNAYSKLRETLKDRYYLLLFI